jgi:hypothetical protein
MRPSVNASPKRVLQALIAFFPGRRRVDRIDLPSRLLVPKRALETFHLVTEQGDCAACRVDFVTRIVEKSLAPASQDLEVLFFHDVNHVMP